MYLTVGMGGSRTTLGRAPKDVRRRVVQRATGLACACLLLAALGSAQAGPSQPPAASTLVAQSSLSKGAILQAILGYTRWPQPRAALVVCVTRTAADAGDIQRQLRPESDGRLLALRLIEADRDLPTDCDVAYFDGWSPDVRHAALRAVAARPVLTLGLGAEFCSDGGLFCLEPVAGSTQFEVNLDSVARSGLHIHPQVLRLAHPPAGKPS
jgi:hypothetical protein